MDEVTGNLKKFNWYLFFGGLVIAIAGFYEAFIVWKSDAGENIAVVSNLIQGVGWLGLAFFFAKQDYFKNGKGKVFATAFCLLSIASIIALAI